MLGNFWVAAQLAASHEGLSSMELVTAVRPALEGREEEVDWRKHGPELICSRGSSGSVTAATELTGNTDC
jgi:hypothetical protein